MNADERAAMIWQNNQSRQQMIADMQQRRLEVDDEPVAVPPQPPTATTIQQQRAEEWAEQIKTSIRANNSMIAEVIGEQTGKLHREMDSTTLALQSQIDDLRNEIADLRGEVEGLRDEQRASKRWFKR